MHERTTLLTGGRVLRNGANVAEKLDVAVGQDGRITAVDRALIPAADTEVIKLAGKLVLPGLVDMHQHLDKSRTRRLVSNPAGTLDGALAGYKKLAANVTRDEIMERAERTLPAVRCSGRPFRGGWVPIAAQDEVVRAEQCPLSEGGEIT